MLFLLLLAMLARVLRNPTKTNSLIKISKLGQQHFVISTQEKSPQNHDKVCKDFSYVEMTSLGLVVA
jgi:hypothetical protein